MPAPLPPAGRKRIMARRNEAQSIFQHDRDHGLWLASGFRLSPLWSVISVFHLRDLCDRGVKLPQDSGLIPPVPCPWSMVHGLITRSLPRYYKLTMRAVHSCRPPQFLIELACQIHRSAPVFGQSKGTANARRKTVRRSDELRGLGRGLRPLVPGVYRSKNWVLVKKR